MSKLTALASCIAGYGGYLGLHCLGLYGMGDGERLLVWVGFIVGLLIFIQACTSAYKNNCRDDYGRGDRQVYSLFLDGGV